MIQISVKSMLRRNNICVEKKLKQILQSVGLLSKKIHTTNFESNRSNSQTLKLSNPPTQKKPALFRTDSN